MDSFLFLSAETYNVGNNEKLHVRSFSANQIFFTGDASNDIHSPGPVIWEMSTHTLMSTKMYVLVKK